MGVWGSIPSHSLALPGACGMTAGFPLDCNLATPYLGCEPKARVTTFYLEMESPSENENVTRIENEFCKILPNEVSMEKGTYDIRFKRKLKFSNKN